MKLHSFNHVLSPIKLQNHANKHFFIVYIVQLDDTRVFQFLQHVDLLFDRSDRCLDLIDHFYSELLLRVPFLARIHDAEGSLPKNFSKHVFVKQSIRFRCTNGRCRGSPDVHPLPSLETESSVSAAHITTTRVESD